MTTSDYSKGLHTLGGGCYAWLQPDGGWGFSNAGLVAGAGESLLVDTLFDLASAADMLAGVAAITTDCPVSTVVNTHSDGDHYFGNEMVGDQVEIIASDAAAELMTQSAVDELTTLKQADGTVGNYVRDIFAPFTFDGITATGPTRTFSGELGIDVGGVEVRLLEVGPAHTAGDVIVHVPEAKAVFSGDILFIGGTPIMWAGPPHRWFAACDLLLELDADTIVPGHGPVTNKSGVAQVRDYLAFVTDEATKRFEQGFDVDGAINSIELGSYADWPERGRLAQNVASVYRWLDPDTPRLDRASALERMATLEGF